jgi:hypothetical protein
MHFSLDKQLPLVVLFNHDERNKRRDFNDMPDMQRRVSAGWKTSQRPSPVPLPEMPESVHGTPSADVGHDVHFAGSGCDGSQAPRRRKQHPLHGTDH